MSTAHERRTSDRSLPRRVLDRLLYGNLLETGFILSAPFMTLLSIVVEFAWSSPTANLWAGMLFAGSVFLWIQVFAVYGAIAFIKRYLS